MNYVLTEQDQKALDHFNAHKQEASFESPDGQYQHGSLYVEENKCFMGPKSLRDIGIDYALFAEGYELSQGEYAAAQGIEKGGNGNENE